MLREEKWAGRADFSLCGR